MGSSRIAQGDQLGALWPPRGVGWGGWGGEMQEGREMGTYCICVADSLCCRAEANTLLWGNYTSIKMFEKKKKRCYSRPYSK